ncbi:MAG: hypothetical protein JJU06_02480 [Ectothiorhodospiraceae bacterium]|nr:hypothetical protein [Ectothiorhodospiraceae bacterium]
MKTQCNTYVRASRRRLRPLLLFALLLGLTGCQALGERICEMARCEPPPSPEDDSLSENEQLLDYLDQMVSVPMERRAVAYRVGREELSASGCDRQLMELAALYMLLSEPPEDDSSMLRTRLEQCRDTQEDHNLSPGLAQVLLNQLAARSAHADRERSLQAVVNAERQRNAELAEQLEALKAIERSIHQRGQGSSRED